MAFAALLLMVLPFAAQAQQQFFLGGATALGSSTAGLAANWLATFPGGNGKLGPYQSVGSGAGQAGFLSNTYLIGTADQGLSSQQDTQAKASGGRLTIPIASTTYSFINSGSSTIQLKGAEIAKIYTGAITDWSAVKNNGGLKGKIIPLSFSLSSGTTKLITEYLHSLAPSIFPASLVGFGPIQFGNPALKLYAGSSAVAAAASQNPSALAYVQTGVGISLYKNYEIAIQNVAGEFLFATRTIISQTYPRTLPPPTFSWAGVSLVNTRGTGTYPIASFAVAYARPSYKGRGALAQYVKPFLLFVLSPSGQSATTAYFYFALDAKVIAPAVAAVKKITA